MFHNPVKGTSTVAIVFSGYTRASFGVSFYGKKRTLKSIGTADSSTLMPLSADRKEIARVDVGHRRRVDVVHEPPAFCPVAPRLQQATSAFLIQRKAGQVRPADHIEQYVGGDRKSTRLNSSH